MTSSPKILVVEDESIVSMEIQGRLEELGYSIAGAVYSGEDAVESAKTLRPDLILMDINLRGEIDGIDAANTIKNSSSIPIIFMTAYADEETIQRAKTSEPYAYIIKPIEMRELHTSIEIALFKHNMEKKLIESEHRFRTLFENATLGLYRSTLSGEIILANNALIKMLGYDNLEDFSKGILINSGYANPNRRNEFIKHLELYGSVVGFESEWKKKDGSIIYISESARHEVDESGNIIYEGTIEDITKRKLYEIKLKESKELLQSIFDNVYNAIFIHDVNGKILDVNEKVLQLYKIDRLQALELNIKDISSDDSPMDKAAEIWQNVVAGKNQLFEWKAKRPNDNFVFDVEVFLTKISFSSETFILANVRDITEQKKVNEALVFSKDKAEESNRLKTEFLASMSHEIRTPVNTILSYSYLLKEELSDLEINQFGDIFHSISIGGQRLIRTVDSILNMSQIQTGTYDVVIQELNFETDIVSPLYSEFKIEAQNKGLKFEFVKKASNVLVNGDSYSLSQLVTNLIDNAIKYTIEGKITITTYNNGNNTLLVDVTDTGIGISEEFQSELFNPFTQETQGYTRKFEGNGLGLALVKKYCEINDITISVRSKKGCGTTFTLEFPKPTL